MEVNNEEHNVDTATVAEDGVATGYKRRRQDESDDDSSSSTSEESGSKSSKAKRRNFGESSKDFYIQSLVNQVNTLTDILKSHTYAAAPTTLSTLPSSSSAAGINTYIPTLPTPADAVRPVPPPISTSSSDSSFLVRPSNIDQSSEMRFLELGHIKTSLKDPKVPSADSERLKMLAELQKFGDRAWKDIRYADALKVHNASPGFVELEVNDELRQFVKGKDYIAGSERAMAAICNALIEQRELLKKNLQHFVDWSAAPDTVLTAANVFEKISNLFHSSSKFHKTSEEIMQIVCGKRAEYIETRRDRVLKELPNKNLQEGLRKIPPCNKCLFDEDQLRLYVQHTGGMDKWIRPWFALDKEGKKNRNQTSKSSESRTSPSSKQPFRARDNFPKTKGGKFNSNAAGNAKHNSYKARNSFKKENQPSKKRYDK